MQKKVENKKHGQTSVEVSVILAVAMIVFIAIFASTGFQLSSFSKSADERLVRSALSKIALSAERVYAQGAGAFEQITVTFPDSVNNSYVLGSTLEVDIVGKDNEVSTISHVSVYGVYGKLPSEGGTYKLVLESNGTAVYITT